MPHSFAVVLPYYNEESFLSGTLRSWMAQTRRPEQLIVVDNGSTDRSPQVCRELLHGWEDSEVRLLHDPRPGKTNALETGCAQVTTTFVALADADTFYPPHYLDTCESMARDLPDDAVSLMALPERGNPASLRSVLRRRSSLLLARALSRHCFVGGYGQVVRTESLRRAGGFSSAHWQYVLLDHEVFNRVFRYGHAVYDVRLWCRPSDRRSDRSRVRWSILERALYHAIPHRLQDWYFYCFLGPRLERRNLSQLNLREKPWQTALDVGVRPG